MMDDAFEKTGVEKDELDENIQFFMKDPEVAKKLRDMEMVV